MANGFGIPRNFRPRSFPELQDENTIFMVADPIPDEVLYGEPGPNGENSPDGTVPDAPEQRWLGGIDFYPINLDALDCASAQCLTPETFLPTAEVDSTGPSHFVPMEVRADVLCSTLGLDLPELKDRLTARFDALSPSMLTNAVLLGGSCWDSNPFINDVAIDAGAANTIYAIDEAVGRLEDAMSDKLSILSGTLFIPQGLLDVLGNRGGLIQDDDDPNAGWTTLLGFDIIADAGVTGEGGTITINGNPVAGGAIGGPFSWIYGTGVLYAHRGPMDTRVIPFAGLPNDADPTKPSTHLLPRNIVRVIARQYMIAVFDPALCWRIPAAYASSVRVS